MRVLLKEEDKLLFIASPEEKVVIGDVIETDGILSQTIDIEFADLPGIMEHILRKSLIRRENISENLEPEIKTILETLSDQKLIITKIRGHISTEGSRTEVKPGFTELKISRERTEPKLIPKSELFQILDLNFGSDCIAKTLGKESVLFDFLANRMGINLITGQKGSGKSYFCKRLLLKLIRAGVLTIVFDVNGEYQYLHLMEDGNTRNEYYDSIRILDRRVNRPELRRLPLRIPLHEISAEQFCKYFYVSTPATEGTIHRFWNQNRGQTFGLDDLEQFARDEPQEMVSNAILSRVASARSLNLFAPMDLRQTLIDMSETGGAIIISLSQVPARFRQMVVSFIQKIVVTMCTEEDLDSACIFLEEAQSYVEPDEFKDLLTRMRHIGIYPTFITNDPQTLPPEIFSLADNLVSFRFKSDLILNQLARTGMIDSDSVKALRILDSRQCLVIGSFSNNFPLFLEIEPISGVKMAGETRPLVPLV